MFKGITISLVGTAFLWGCTNNQKTPVPAAQANTAGNQVVNQQLLQQAIGNQAAVPLPSAQAPAGQQAFQQGGINQQLLVQQLGGRGGNFHNVAVDLKNTQPLNIPLPPADKNLIQLALLLDTSNSMDGLIDQAKSQLWKIVNELAKANKNGKDIRFEVALFEYGNDNLKSSDGYIRKVQCLTSDLDQISEDLFSLRTRGGSEYCGHVISSAVNRLKWNPSPDALKMIYIAGNEPFTQGSVDYKDATMSAATKGLVANTIFCGDYEQGIQGMWKHGATLGKGDYFSINSDKKLQGIETPYDDELIKLSTEMNQTYVAYGNRRAYYSGRQSLQDTNALSISKSISAGRAASKGSKLYVNYNWDLVDAMDQKNMDLTKVPKEDLPENLRDKSPEQLRAHLQEKLEERKKIKKKIADLSKKRTLFIADKLKEMGEKGEETLDTVMIKSLRDQAKARGFAFKE